MSGSERPLLHVVAGLGPGGAENFLLKLLRHDPALRERSAVLSIRPQTELLPQFEALGVPVTCLPIRPDWRIAMQLLRIHRQINAPHVRLVQSWLYLADSVASVSGSCLGSKPIVWGIRSSHGAAGKRWTGLLARRLNPWLSRRHVLRIICCGELAREAHRALGYAAERLLVIPNGYDVSTLHRDPAAGLRLRETLGIDTSAPVIGMVAREDIYKDHDTLLAACRRVADRLPDLRVLLCGKGTDGEAMRTRIRKHGLQAQVLALGVRHDMANVYAAIDVHVLSSRTEGFPNVVAESTLNGCLSYCTAVGEAPRMLPSSDYLLPVGDVSTMAEALLHGLLMSPGERSSRVAQQRAHLTQHYAMPGVADRYKSTYEQLAPGLFDALTSSSE